MPPFAKEQLRKVFVGGLNLSTTEESMKEYFSRWGECVDVVVMRYPDSRRSRGFGFVTYENVESVDAVLNAKPHILDGKDIEPKRAVAKDETGRPGSLEAEKSKKVFVGGLASSTTEEDVRECFTKFCEEAGRGRVEEVMILRDKENHDRLRGFCFVTFDCDEIVDKVCAVKHFEIRTKSVEVRRAESRQTMRLKEEKESGYRRRNEDRYPRREMDSPRGLGNMGGFGSGMNPVAMQAALSGGAGMPFFGGAFGGSKGGPGGFGGGFGGMNPYGFGGMMGGFNPGMLNMLANSMGMNAMAGGMGGGAMGGSGMGGSGMGSGVGMGMGGEQGFKKDRMDSVRGSSGSSAGYKSGGYSGDSHNGSASNPADASAYSTQNTSGYDQMAAMSNQMVGGDMTQFANQMNSMWGAGGMNPANVQAAMLAGYSGMGMGMGMDSGGDYNQLGAYNQTSSSYGPSRGTGAVKATTTDTSRRSFKPY